MKNNYGFFERTLHDLIFSKDFLISVGFDLECEIFSEEALPHDTKPVFVAGLARSGSTALLTAIFGTGAFASMSYSDMPFALSPNLWKKLNFASGSTDAIERAHGDGLKISTDSPEAFEEIFWRIAEKKNWPDHYFKRHISHVQKAKDKKRYLSKNNQNIKRIPLIANVFPEATILIPFRHPLSQSESLFSQHTRFGALHNHDRFYSRYMRYIGHSEFGPNYSPIYNQGLRFKDPQTMNHWLEQWIRCYSKALEESKYISKCKLVCYEDLCDGSMSLENILWLIEIDTDTDFEFRLGKSTGAHEFDNDLVGIAGDLYSMLCKEARAQWGYIPSSSSV